MADFDWSLYLKLAERLIDEAEAITDIGIKEAMIRSAISRSYYSVFKAAYEVLLEEAHPWIVYDAGVTAGIEEQIADGRNLLNISEQELDKEFQRKVGSMHTFVAKTFKNSSILNRKNLGLDLFDLKVDRQDADYNGACEVTIDWAKDVLKKSHRARQSVLKIKQAQR
jgi:uncharacterized protein (UPF0332 family)